MSAPCFPLLAAYFPRGSSSIRGAPAVFRGGSVAVPGAPVAVRGAPVAVRGVPVSVRGAPVAVHDTPVSLPAVPMAVRGAPVAVRGAPMAVRGASVAVRGARVADASVAVHNTPASLPAAPMAVRGASVAVRRASVAVRGARVADAPVAVHNTPASIPAVPTAVIRGAHASPHGIPIRGGLSRNSSSSVGMARPVPPNTPIFSSNSASHEGAGSISSEFVSPDGIAFGRPAATSSPIKNKEGFARSRCDGSAVPRGGGFRLASRGFSSASTTTLREGEQPGADQDREAPSSAPPNSPELSSVSVNREEPGTVSSRGAIRGGLVSGRSRGGGFATSAVTASRPVEKKEDDATETKQGVATRGGGFSIRGDSSPGASRARPSGFGQPRTCFGQPRTGFGEPSTSTNPNTTPLGERKRPDQEHEGHAPGGQEAIVTFSGRGFASAGGSFRGASRARTSGFGEPRTGFGQPRTGFGQPRTGFGEPSTSTNPNTAPLGERKERGAPAPGERLGPGPGNPASKHIPEVVKVDELFGEDASESAKGVPMADEDVTAQKVKENQFKPYKTWEECEFPPKLLQNVMSRSKYRGPRNIQAQVMPIIDAGLDVIGHAETGSGKTAAFILPLIKKIMQTPAADQLTRCSPIALVIAPTRELVLQLANQTRKFADQTGVSVAKAYGEYALRDNIVDIRSGCDILCATTGRLKGLVESREVRFKNLRYLVLDEADHLLATSFWEDIIEIMRTFQFPDIEKRQTMLFSATFSDEVCELATKILKPNYAVVSVPKTVFASPKIDQMFVTARQSEKNAKIVDILSGELEKEKKRFADAGIDEEKAKMPRTLVFVAYKRTSDAIAEYLSNRGISAESINSDRSQDKREKALGDFRRGRCEVLVATDVCARGLDVHDMEYVVNYDLPHDATTYVHRIGRTGRLFKGKATSFVDPLSDSQELVKELVDVVRGVRQEPPQFLVDLSEGKTLPGFEEEDDTQLPPLPESEIAPPATELPVNEDW